MGVGLLCVLAVGGADGARSESGETAVEPDRVERVEDRPVGAPEILERQRRAYDAFRDRQRQQYEAFEERRRAEYEAYMERMHAQLELYRQIVGQAEDREKDRIAQRWDEPELSSSKVWVEYDADLDERRRVDFEQQIIAIESLADDERGASPDRVRASLRRKLRALLIEDRATAFRRDAVSQAIEARSRQEVDLLETAEVTPRPILWSYLTGQDRVDETQLELAVDLLVARAVIRETLTGSGERLQQATIPLEPDLLIAQLEKLQAAPMNQPVPESDLRPSAGGTQTAPEFVPLPSSTGPAPTQPAPTKPGRSGAQPATEPEPGPVSRRPGPPSAPPSASPPAPPSAPQRLPARARAFEHPVHLYGSRARLEPALVYAIIETESAFNPVARSPVPAYGLMQIVPQSAGQDATEALFGRPRILAPSYLYDADKNIEIGTVYLELLMTRYLSGIDDPQSRLYCAIAAYNTGHGNVFKSFTGQMRPKAAFERINRMSSRQVYEHLLRHLPHAETRSYLPTVVSRLSRYRGWMSGS